MQEGMSFICVLLWDGKGQSNGRVNLRRPYNEDKLGSSAGGGGGGGIKVMLHIGIIV